MAELINLIYKGMSCDASRCQARLDCPETDIFSGRERHQEAAARLGWTIWIGRSRRTYCSEHGPKPGHRMSEVTPAVADVR